ncbi:putative ribonuclease H-like domain-containing protein [Tanacetum coccineum]
MASTRAFISKASKRPKINIISPKQLFVDLTHDDTKTPSPTLQLSSPSTPNALSKTPSTKDTSSSSIDYIAKSPTSSTSLLPNGYLNPPTSPPLRVSPPPLTQENTSMDITLTLSPITPLDVQFDSLSPSLPIVGHPIPWNLLEAHGDSCLCCIHNQESRINQEQDANVNSTNNINTVSPTVNATNIENNVVGENIVYGCIDDLNMPNLEEIVYSDDDEEVDAEADMNNLAITVSVSHIPTTRVHKDHPLEQIIGDIQSAPQTRRMTKNVTKHEEPKKVTQALTDLSWIEAMQDELLQNKKDNRGIMVRNKAILVAQGYTQEEGVDYDEVFDPVARIEAIRLFLAYASFMNFVVYQMDVKSAFLYGTIEEDVYVCQPPGFEDPEFPNKVYKVEKALYGLHQAPRAWYETLSTYLLKNRFRRGTIDKTLFIKKDKGDILLVQVKQKDDGIFISQYKYVADILKKFDFATMRTTSTPMDTNKALLKDEEAADVDVHLYKSMIGSLMYLTASRPDIMFVVYSPFDLEAFSDSDYAGASLDRKSTTGGCQFLGRRLISWQCKKQTIVANSTTEAEYVAAANCCGQVLWIQNQLLDYGYNFMNTKIFIDNESTICIVKNPVFHSKTKHIEIRHHFIRDSYEKRLIQVIKIHTNHNVADLLTKVFDVSRFQYLIASIGMLNL